MSRLFDEEVAVHKHNTSSCEINGKVEEHLHRTEVYRAHDHRSRSGRDADPCHSSLRRIDQVRPDEEEDRPGDGRRDEEEGAGRTPIRHFRRRRRGIHPSPPSCSDGGCP